MLTTSRQKNLVEPEVERKRHLTPDWRLTNPGQLATQVLPDISMEGSRWIETLLPLVFHRFNNA